MRTAVRWLGATVFWLFMATWVGGMLFLAGRWIVDSDWQLMLVSLVVLTALVGAAIVGSSRKDADYRAPYEDGP